jgi:hypothetical protein
MIRLILRPPAVSDEQRFLPADDDRVAGQDEDREGGHDEDVLEGRPDSHNAHETEGVRRASRDGIGALADQLGFLAADHVQQGPEPPAIATVDKISPRVSKEVSVKLPKARNDW